MVNPDLSNYIQQARKSGAGDDKIRQALIKIGWPSADIEEAFRLTELSRDIVQIPGGIKVPNIKFSYGNLRFIIIALVISATVYFGGAYLITRFQRFPLWPFEATAPQFTPRVNSK